MKQPTHSHRHTVLVIDDDPDQLDILATLLQFDDYQVISAQSGEIGLKVLDRKQVDAIVTDVAMPGMNGIEFVGQVRKRLGADVPPIVLITAGLRNVTPREQDFRVDALYLKQNLKSTLLPGLRNLLA